MYSDDNHDALPVITNGVGPVIFTDYVLLIRNYVGLSGGTPSPQDKLFACPADTFYYVEWQRFNESLYLQPVYKYSSYGFNAGNMDTGFTSSGVAGSRLDSIKDPAKTVLATEWPTFLPYSWHQPAAPYDNNYPPYFNNARDIVSFVDGHVNYIKIYWDTNNTPLTHSEAWQYEPPADYDYKWSGD